MTIRAAHVLLLAASSSLALVGCGAADGGGAANAISGDSEARGGADVLEGAETSTVGAETSAQGSGPDPLDASPGDLVVDAQVPGRVVAGSPTWLDARGTELPSGVSADFHWTCTDGTEAEGDLVEVMFADAGVVTCMVGATVAGDPEARLGSTMLDIWVRDTASKWTVMVFVNGDNNLESAALDDLMEMEMVGSTDDVQVVVQVDRTEGYTTAAGDWTTSRRYLITTDPARGIGSRMLEDLGEVDSGDWNTMADFVDWSGAHFPAERYAFVMWNHGEGWKSGAAADPYRTISDDDTSGTTVSIAGGDLENLLDAATRSLGQPLELLGADACNMQTFELGWVAAPYAEFLVASQEIEANDGWPYDAFLADLAADPDMDGGALGERIATRFVESKDQTQSVVDLAQVDALASALDALSIVLMDAPEGAGQVLDAAGSAWSSSYNPDNADLGHLLDALMADAADLAVREAAARARVELDAAVLANRTYGYDEGMAPTGLSIHVGNGRQVVPAYLDASWSQALLWDDMVSQALAE